MANSTSGQNAAIRHCTTWVVIRTFIAAALAAGAIAYLCGCGPSGPVSNLVRKLIGAPSIEQIATEQQRLTEAQNAVDALDTQVRQAQAYIDRAEAEAEAAHGRKGEIRRLYAEMAGQLAALEGAAADAMIQALGELHRQLRLADDDRAGALAVAGDYQAELAKIQGKQSEAGRIIDDAEANLQGFQDATAAAVAGAVGGARLAADAAGALGVPGAALIGDKVAGFLRVGLEGLLGVGTVAGIGMTRRRRRERDGERRRRMNLTRIIGAVKEFGLLKDDKDLREGAKHWAGADAHREMKLAEAAMTGPAADDVAA